MHLGGNRAGVLTVPKAAGEVYCKPDVSSVRKKFTAGSWLEPDANHCNPLGFQTCYKTSIAHSGMKPGQVGAVEARRTAAIFVKTIWCIKMDESDLAKCQRNQTRLDPKCPTQKCYSDKFGRCVRFGQDIWHSSGHQQKDQLMSMREKARHLYDKGEYSECSEEGKKAVQGLVSGN